MRAPNLSLENIATAIAALGTSAVLAACTKAAEPSSSVRADEPAQASAASPPPPPVATASPTAVTEQDQQKKEGAASAAPMTQPPQPSQLRRGPGGAKPTGTTGQASCGAGTCTADPKKK
jgi:hypothetical protein